MDRTILPEGEAVGRTIGALNLVLRQLTRKVSNRSSELISRVSSLNPDALSAKLRERLAVMDTPRSNFIAIADL